MKAYDKKNDLPLLILYFTFALSGFAGLIYESIWTHYLKLFLGHAAYAQTLVLVIFMGGLATGSLIASRKSHKMANPLYGYAAIELIVGLLALGFHSVFVSVTDYSHTTIIPTLESPTLIEMYKWGLAGILILPQSILLGATFPLMSSGIIRFFTKNTGKTLSLLYFTNSIGAAVGVIISGFILIGLFGLPGTIAIAGFCNLLIAAIVFITAYLLSEKKPYTPFKESKPAQTDISRFSSRTKHLAFSQLRVILFVSAALTGTASFMYEVGWIRMLSLVLGSSTHAFELMLSAFILGLAIGSYWIKSRLDNAENPLARLGLIQLSMGILALATLVLYSYTYLFMGYTLKALTQTDIGYWLFNLASGGIAQFIMLPSAICAGMTLPIITYSLIKLGHGEIEIGKVYAFNTLGSILGVVIAIQLILPILGMKNLIIIGASIDIGIGLLLLYYYTPPMEHRRWKTISICTIGLVGVIGSIVTLDPQLISSGVYRTGKINLNNTVIYHQDGKTASVDVVHYQDNSLSIKTNGKSDAAISLTLKPNIDEPTMILLGALPLALHSNPQRVANIGMGSGLTAHTVLQSNKVKSLDTIEIEPAIVEGAKLFGDKVSNTFTDPRSHIYIQDAKTYFTSNKDKFDIIISEPSNPWVSGVSGLFSTEFYSLAKRYLNEGGLLVQWMHLYEIDEHLVSSIMKAISENFLNYSVFATTNNDIIVVAHNSPLSLNIHKHIFESSELAKTLNRIGVETITDLSFRNIGGKKTLEALFNSYKIPANSDYFPVLDEGAVKARYLNRSAKRLLNLHQEPAPIMEILEQNTTNNSILQLGTNESIYFEAANKAKTARYIFNYLEAIKNKTEKPDVSHHSVLALSTINEVLSLQNLCIDNVIDQVWLPSLRKLMEMTLPYLTKNEMKELWNTIDTNQCDSALSRIAQQWITLYLAISKRDHNNVISISEKILSESVDTKPYIRQNDGLITLPPKKAIPKSPENELILLNYMTSSLALKKHQAAIAMWERYKHHNIDRLSFKLLLAHAKNNSTMTFNHPQLQQ